MRLDENAKKKMTPRRALELIRQLIDPKLLIENHIVNSNPEITELFKYETRKMISILGKLGYQFELEPTIGKTFFLSCRVDYSNQPCI